MHARLGHQPALDGVRALAICGVVSFHAFGFPEQGFLGVDLFFVLSGFLITTLLLEEHAANGRIAFLAFYRRRALRLIPALVVVIFVYVAGSTLVALVTFDSQRLTSASSAAVTGIFYGTNFMLAFAGQDSVPVGLSHLWSLSLEEQFYFVWPVLLFVVARARHALAITVVVTGIVLVTARQMHLLADGARGDRLDFGPDTRSGAILFGCLAGLLYVSPARPHLSRAVRHAAPAALFVAFGLVLLGFGRLIYAGPLTVYGLCAAILVLWVVTSETWFSRLLGTRPLVFLGLISYSLYLWHIPTFEAFGIDTKEVFASGGILRKFSAIAIASALAVASYYFIERPFLRRKRKTDRSACTTEPVPLAPSPSSVSGGAI